ncbi:four-carbon acid sugar kinase family protein [Bacillus sp. FSL R5-0654]|uniref:four-carbon acid sugar kinase family protein n=1 Tax=Bacillus TaxID=1386 RepID=UPI0005CA2214|nr:four-carbon acid sugar kinase family protein [Bacillus safensis]KIZ53912.1 hydroxyacid dehydrogenase [Bacillus safensis]MBR0611889.1 hydroxyacid dehydrogenase [Bacillus safensis]MBR0633838.1 hydroxyacid dehydrogenase [Bacillus safensis]MEC1414368.1 four-carbon acid sugar kinase family protein [Bacillus safensis]WLW69432.1 four-carbon acid sugar kinase family protein [Bacillus safensis]
MKQSTDILNAIPKADSKVIQSAYEQALSSFQHKVIVLDDDPTGIQTVHGVSVFTDWSEESIEAGFLEDSRMFFILTNSRSMTEKETAAAHKTIAATIVKVAKRLNQDFVIVSRGDSTLRGHFPLETEVLKTTIEQQSSRQFDGEILLPFFQEGGRFTIDNIHYVQEGHELIPAGDTEFARDRTFGFQSSHLGEWIEEKSEGMFTKENTTYISLADLRALRIDQIKHQLMSVKDFKKVVVNAVDYDDVKVFVTALIEAIQAGQQLMFRSAAALTKVLGGIGDQALLTRDALIQEESPHGGLIMIGSHVKKTTEQLKALQQNKKMAFIEFNTHLVLEPDAFREEINRVIQQTEALLAAGQSVAVYTRRERLDLGDDRQEEELKLSVQISDAVTSIVQRLTIRPKYLIAKGGITSSDIGTRGLSVKRATVAGQIKPGIPVWQTGEESKFPFMSYVIFPGNVGAKDTLKEAVDILEG